MALELEKYAWAVVGADGAAVMFTDKPTAQTYAEGRAKEGHTMMLCKASNLYKPNFTVTNV